MMGSGSGKSDSGNSNPTTPVDPPVDPLDEIKEEIANLFTITEPTITGGTNHKWTNTTALHTALKYFVDVADNYSSDEEKWKAVQDTLKNCTLEYYPNISADDQCVLGDSLKDAISAANPSSEILSKYVTPILSLVTGGNEEDNKDKIEKLTALLSSKYKMKKPTGKYSSTTGNIKTPVDGENGYVAAIMNYSDDSDYRYFSFKDAYKAYFAWEGTSEETIKVSKTKDVSNKTSILDKNSIVVTCGGSTIGNDKTVIELPYKTGGYSLSYSLSSTPVANYDFSCAVTYDSYSLGNATEKTDKYTDTSKTIKLKELTSYKIKFTVTPQDKSTYKTTTKTITVKITSPIKDAWENQGVKDKLSTAGVTILGTLVWESLSPQKANFYNLLNDKTFYQTITTEPYSIKSSDSVYSFTELLTPLFLREIITTLDEGVTILSNTQYSDSVLYKTGALDKTAVEAANGLTVAELVGAFTTPKSGKSLIDRLIDCIEGGSYPKISSTDFNTLFTASEKLTIGKLVNILQLYQEPAELLDDVNLFSVSTAVLTDPFSMFKNKTLGEKVRWLVDCLKTPIVFEEDVYSRPAGSSSKFGYHQPLSVPVSAINLFIASKVGDKYTINSAYYDVNKLMKDIAKIYSDAILAEANARL